MRVVGIGSQDDLTYAKRFLGQTGVTFTMLWSDSFESWNHFDVSRNSAVLLLDSDGNLVDESAASFDSQSLVERLAELA